MTVTWTWDTSDEEDRDDYESKLADVQEASKLRMAIWDYTEWLQRAVRKSETPPTGEQALDRWLEIVSDYNVHPWEA